MTSTTFGRIAARRAATGFPGRCLQGLQEAARGYRRYSTRRDLKRLNADQLRDIGLDPARVSGGPAHNVDPRTMIRLLSMW